MDLCCLVLILATLIVLGYILQSRREAAGALRPRTVLGASRPRAALSALDATAPGATAPGATAPGATAPGATAPGATAPGATAPDATAPGATAPGATTPDATAPGATTPDATAPGAGTVDTAGTASLSRTGAAPSAALHMAAQRVQEASLAAAVPAPPQFEPLNIEVLPERYWQPTFEGCSSTFTEQSCDFSAPMPRLWETDLDRLMFERNLAAGQVNLLEPIGARQAMMQFLTLGTRSKKDPYTQASAANDIATQNTCASVKSKAPDFVNF